ncbi:MAG: response regulator [Desulfovibrio sp.]
MRLHLKVGLLLLMMGLVPLLTLGGHALFRLETTLRENTNRSLLALCGQIGRDVQRTANEGMRGLRMLANDPMLASPETGAAALRNDLLRAQRFHPIFRDIALLDTKGHVRASIGNPLRGDWSETLWFKRAMLGQESFFGAQALLYPSDVVVTVSAPLSAPGQEKISGVIVAHLDMRRIWGVVQGAERERNGRAMLVDDNGLVIGSSAPERLLRPLGDPALRDALRGRVRGILPTGKGPEDLAGVFAEVTDGQADEVHTGWKVLLFLTEKEASAGVDGVHHSLILAGTLLLLSVVLLSLLFSRVVKRWLGRFTDVLQRLGTGDFNARMEAQGRDEIAQLAMAVNRTAKKLQESATRLHHYQLDLEEQVRTRTRELETAKNEAERASRAKSEFLANMSHEIRTPLNAINGLTEIVLQGDLAPGQKESLETVLDSAEHLLNVFNDILDFSLAESSRLELTASDFDLHAVLRSVVNALRLQSEAKGLSLSLNIAPDTPRFLRGDAGRLRQILFNLAGNAVKFTKKGNIAVHAGLAYAQDDDAESRLSVLFSVRDTGTGIPREVQESIFESFQRGEMPTDLVQRGPGLGLSICSRLVKLMRGRIWLDSTPGKGSEFFFTASFSPGDPGQALMPEKLHARALHADTAKRLKVLVAEDNPVNIKVVTLHLDKLGHDCKVAVDGEQALKLLTSETFDLVFMDVEMPGMDGLEATRRIRAGLEHVDPTIPIVALTAHTTDEVKQRCFRAGMDDFLTKPVRMGDLGILLRRFAPLHPDEGKTPMNDRPPLAPETKNFGTAQPVPERPVPRQGGVIPPINRLAAMQRLGIDDATFDLILASALAESQKRLDLARAALDEGDMESLRRHAHTIKSSAKSIGAETCHNIAVALEQAALANNPERCEELFQSLRNESETLRREIEHGTARQQEAGNGATERDET